MSPAYCAVDIARHFGSQDGLVMADAVLAAGVSREVLAGWWRTWNDIRVSARPDGSWNMPTREPRVRSKHSAEWRFSARD